MASPGIACLSVKEFLSFEYDFVVVGGGTAGLAVASRLAESGKFSVGVLEAGDRAVGDDLVDVPAFYGRSLGGKYDWQFETTAQPGLGGRKLPWPRGKVLGGTSALNFMTWNRASREDYDAWEALGNSGWGWDLLLPYFKKAETFHIPDDDLKNQVEIPHDPEAFGTSGPIQISYNKEYSASHVLWHQTWHKLGVETNPAHVTGSNVGVWTNINSVHPTSATRSYSTSYVSAIAPRLRVLCNAHVNKINLEKNSESYTATGVNFSAEGQQFNVKVSREVILSSGSICSPHILELSGIGNQDVLSKAGIETFVNLPKVGENLQDHIMLAMIFEVRPDLDTPDDLLKDEAAAEVARAQYAKERTGPYTVLPCAISYIPFSRIFPENTVQHLAAQAQALAIGSPQKKQILQQRFHKDSNLGQIEYIFDLGNWHPHFPSEPGKKYGTLLQILQYPFSVGSIHTKPRNETKTPSPSQSYSNPHIDPGYYQGSHGQLDFDVHELCSRFAHRIVATEPLSNIVKGPAFPPEAVVKDPELMKKWIVNHTITDWHPVGTCGMGGKAGKEDGVVDERLRVYDVKGLRVVDASIMPLQISSHPQATVYAIAEKGAAMILEDHH